MTDQYAVFGHPVEQSWSPFIHGLFARQTGQDIQYRKIDVPPSEFAQQVRDFFAAGGKGLNITVPHKLAALSVAAEVAPRAAEAGAANTLAVRSNGDGLIADNTDGFGLVRDLRHNIGLDLGGARILICGAGGATRGVLGPLLAEEPQQIVVANRNLPRGELLLHHFGDRPNLKTSSYEDLATAPAFDLIVNATSAGLQGDNPPLPQSTLRAHSVCYDMSYGKTATPFMLWAGASGAKRVYKGWGMLVEQAAESFRIWRGIEPDTAPVLAVLQEQIAY